MNKTNLFLLAAPRSGSTQLSAWLSSHPDIECTFVKEPNFFSNHEFSSDYVDRTHLNDIEPSLLNNIDSFKDKSFQFAIYRREEDYQVLVDYMSSRYKMDASTTYLHCPESIGKILSYNPEAKFIILLRDPVARLISHYRLAVRTGREKDCFSTRLRKELSGYEILPSQYLIRQSLYADAVESVKELVKPENVCLVFFEDLIKNPQHTLSVISEFLDVSSSEFDVRVIEKNEGVSPRFPRLNRFLYWSGIKTYLRSILSKDLKQKIKSIYFSEKRISVDTSELQPVMSLLRSDRQRLEMIVEGIGNKWKELPNEEHL